jgi:hypothetical protein
MAAGAAAAAAIANAIKASGVLVRVAPAEFQKIVNRGGDLVVVVTPPSVWTSQRRYLTSYRGLAFFTKTTDELMFGSKAEIISCDKIWIPG